MKIIHVTDTSIYNYDGISTYANELIECSTAKGDEILVITTTPHGTNVRSGYEGKNKISIIALPCLRVPGKPKFVIIFTKGLKKMIENFQPDLIWIHTIGTLGMKAANLAINKWPVIYTKHCFDAELWCGYLNAPKFMEPLLYSSAEYFENQILKASKFIVYHLGDVSKVKNNKYFNKFMIFSPPLNSKYFENKKVRTSYDISKPLRLGFCGRCDPDKGIADTFKALEIFQKKYKEINFEFFLIGDGPEAHRLKNKYPSMNVTITGYIDNVIPYLDQLDGFVLSSLQETISLSSLEAYARGIPIFSVPRGYLSENIEKLNNFYLFDSHENLADLIYNKLVINNYATTNSDLSTLNGFVISYNDLYAQVMKKLFN